MNDHLGRLRAMAAGDDETWDLSENDRETIRWAIDQADSHARLRRGVDAMFATLEALDATAAEAKRKFRHDKKKLAVAIAMSGALDAIHGSLSDVFGLAAGLPAAGGEDKGESQ